jgi:hypothetical protein
VLFFNDAFLQKAADRIRIEGDAFDRTAKSGARAMYRVNGSLWLKER